MGKTKGLIGVQTYETREVKTLLLAFASPFLYLLIHNRFVLFPGTEHYSF